MPAIFNSGDNNTVGIIETNPITAQPVTDNIQ